MASGGGKKQAWPRWVAFTLCARSRSAERGISISSGPSRKEVTQEKRKKKTCEIGSNIRMMNKWAELGSPW